MRNVVSIWSEVMVDLDDIEDENLIDELVARGYQVIAPDEQVFEDEDVETDFDTDEDGMIGHA